MRAQLRASANDLDGAISDHDKAIELASAIWMNIIQRAKLKQAAGDEDGARADIAKICETRPQLKNFILRLMKHPGAERGFKHGEN
jgi:uncharacterized protein HemY